MRAIIEFAERGLQLMVGSISPVIKLNPLIIFELFLKWLSLLIHDCAFIHVFRVMPRLTSPQMTRWHIYCMHIEFTVSNCFEKPSLCFACTPCKCFNFPASWNFQPILCFHYCKNINWRKVQLDFWRWPKHKVPSFPAHLELKIEWKEENVRGLIWAQHESYWGRFYCGNFIRFLMSVDNLSIELPTVGAAFKKQN